MSARFYAMAEEIAAQLVEVVDYEGEYHSPEVAVRWFSCIDHFRDASAATWLQWRAGTLRADRLAAVLAQLPNVRSMRLVNARVGDVLPMLQMESVVLECCTLWFPELNLFLAAIPSLQSLVIEGHGTVFERGVGVEAEYEPALTLPVTLSRLEVDARHAPEGERALYWFRAARGLTELHVGMTGAVGWYPGTNIVDDSQECLEVLTLALGVSVFICRAVSEG